MRAPLAAGVLALAIYLLTAASDLLGNGDTSTFRFGTTHAIVEHQRLWLDLVLGPDELRAATGRGNHAYASYGPGQSIMMIPLYLGGRLAAGGLRVDPTVAEQYATRTLDPLLAALATMLVVVFALRLGYGRTVAVLLGLVFAFGSVAWPDAQSGLEQTAVEFFVLLAAYAAWKWVVDPRHDRRALLLSGTGLGLAFWTRYDALIYLVTVGGYIIFVSHRSGRRDALRSLATLALGFLPWALFVAAWDTIAFGNPFDTGTHPATWSMNLLGNALGLTLSPGKGLLWYLPLVALLPWCVRRFGRRPGHVLLLFGALAGVTMLFYSFIAYWHGDPSWGPRYLYPVTPFLILPLGEWLTRWRLLRTTARSALVSILGLSMLVQVAAVSVTPWRFWYRLEALQERTFNVAEWSGRPFLWGPTRYHYYWNPRLSPVLVQVDDVYQVLRLQVLGDRRYLLTTKPASLVQSNTAAAYPVNTLAFWWADDRHPMFGSRGRAAVILALLGIAGIAGVAGWWEIRSAAEMPEMRSRPVRRPAG